MCSRDREQVEFVKRELSRVGIQTEIRSNPLAAALRVSRLELWVPDDRDFKMASQLYAQLEARFGEGAGNARLDIDAAVEVIVEEPPPPRRATRVNDSTPRLVNAEPASSPPPNNTHPANDLEQAGALLEQEIEALLARESELEQKVEVLQGKVKSLTDSLNHSQSQVTREVNAREAVEKKAALLAESQAGLQRDVRDLQNQLRTKEQSLSAAKADLQSSQQESRAQQAKVAELSTELAKAQNQIVAERQGRTAAEERAGKLASEIKTLEQKIEEQARLQQQLQSYAGNLNSLRNKLRDRNNARSGSS